MLRYYDIIDKAVLLVCCLSLYILLTDAGIVPILIAVTVSSLVSFFDNCRIKQCITVAFILLCVYITGLTIFLPLVCYDLFLERYYYVSLLSLIPVYYFCVGATLRKSLIFLAIFIVSVILKHRTNSYIKFLNRFRTMSDSASEMSIKLKEQNNDLLEKQDYEINLATLNERSRIAREIHDNVGHLLSSAILQVGALLTISRDATVREHLGNLNNTLSQAMNSIRSSVHNLYDESIDLNSGIEELLKKFTYCEVGYDYQLTSNPSTKLKYAFIFIVKEALSNIIRHSDATYASITFREHPAIYQLIIRDNGTVDKFDMENGIGLKNMTDRIEAFSGNIRFSAENGFEIFISVPKGDI